MIPCNAPGTSGPADRDESDLYADFDARVKVLVRERGMTYREAHDKAYAEQEAGHFGDDE